MTQATCANPKTEVQAIAVGDRVEFTPEVKALLQRQFQGRFQADEHYQGIVREVWVKEGGIYLEVLFDDGDTVTLHSQHFQRVALPDVDLYDDIPW